MFLIKLLISRKVSLVSCSECLFLTSNDKTLHFDPLGITTLFKSHSTTLSLRETKGLASVENNVK